MKISQIQISNYRGVKVCQNIPLNNFSSIVGQNDSGKSIILNAIASFLNLKEFVNIR
jgi:AAA15 family ATPase/GTPase